MNKNLLANKTKKLALAIIKFCTKLPQKQEFWVISNQVIKSATSIGANYRSACRSKSKADFIAKLPIMEEEADETLYWLELLEELAFKGSKELEQMKNETDQIVAIVVASKKTAKKNM